MRRLVDLLNKIIKKHKALKKWQRIVTVLAAIITFVTTYALILPAITVEKDETDLVSGMYLEEVTEIVGDGEEEAPLEDAFVPMSFVIAADQENAVTYSYEDDDIFAELVISTDEELPEGTELVVNYVDPESEDYAGLSSRARDLLSREFIKEISTCSFYDFALVCDNIDVTPVTGYADIRIFFHNNTVEHTDDALYVGKFALPLIDEGGLLPMSADEAATQVDVADDYEEESPTEEYIAPDELVSVNGDETSVFELSDGIITSLSLKGCDLARDDSVVGILAGFVDEEIKTEAEESEMISTASEDISDAEQQGNTTSEPSSGTLTASGSDYTLKLTYDETSGVPAGAGLEVLEIAQDSEEYRTYLEETKKAMGLTEEESLPQYAARFFDIKIMVDGEEFIPESGVTVEIAYTEPLAANPETEVNAVHFQDDESEPEVINARATEVADDGTATVEFQAESFSVYGVIYTVDFHWEVNGRLFQFTLKGGDAVSFSRLIQALDIVDSASEDAVSGDEVPETNEKTSSEEQEPVVTAVGADELVEEEVVISDATKKFLDQVKSVEFSNPDYLWVGKIDEDVTVGDLLYKYELVPDYPYGMTASEYGAFVTREYKAPDWILISLQPFSSEEALTITMNNGEEIVIRVTDDADAVIISDPTYGNIVQTIPNPNGTSFDLIDYWITDGLRNSQGMDGWPGHQGDAFSSWQFDHYNYNGQWQSGAVPMERDWTINDEYFVSNGHLRGNGNNQGINTGHAFKFYPGAAGTVVDYGDKGTHIHGTYDAWTNNHDHYTSINSWTGDADPTTGLVKPTLVNGYPELTDSASLGTDGQSLAYLFDDSSHAGKQKYSGMNNLLYVDSEGYYTYDSRYYSATKEGNSFIVREHASNANQAQKGFWPFGDRVNWHGMHMTTNFSMPANGQVLNPQGDYKDMQFEFSGDDDTWVYVDGVLIGDGGGIHNRTEIDINFATGKVIVTGQNDPNHQGTYYSELWLDDIFRAQKGDAYVAENFDGHTFKQGSKHTFEMFYLERGGSESNLYIHYNLVSTTDFSAHKSYHTEDNTGRLTRDQFKFELIGFDNPEYESGFRQAIMPANGTTNGAGTFASPKKVHSDTAPVGLDYPATLNPGAHTSLITGVTEDGNVNFGNIQVQESQAGKTYYYAVREVVPDDAVNADGIRWDAATPEQKAEGGFVKGGITYDGRVYYFTGTVQETSEGSNEYELKKTRYTDSTYTTVDTETKFFSFVNGYVAPLALKVVKKNSVNNKLLSGAEFKLTRAMKNSDNQWVRRAYNSNGATILAQERIGTTAGGYLTFNNLTEGHYILEETRAPAGYAMGETTKWLLTLTKVDTKDSILLVPTLTELNADGTVKSGASEETLTVGNDNIFEKEILNTKLPRGDIEVQKQWLKPDGTPYTAAELDVLEGAEDVTVTGELWRRYMTEPAAAPTVKIYSKLNNETDYQLRWEEQVEPGTKVSFSMAVNSTGYPINQQYTTDTGAALVQEADQDIYYDYVSGTQIHKTSGHVYALKDINADVSIYGVFDSSKASNNNNPRIGFKMLTYTAPTGPSQPVAVEQKVGDFTLDKAHGWTVTWTSAQLNEVEDGYEYFFKNVSEQNGLEGFTFVSTPGQQTDTATGKVTYSFKNVKEGNKTELTVRKVWTDGDQNHSDDTVTYKLQRTEYNADGQQTSEAYDYIPDGETQAPTFTLTYDDVYNGAHWTKNHEQLPADNGKDLDNPDYREYRYSVEETVPEGYTVSYGEITEGAATVQIMRNAPKQSAVAVDKLWLAPDGDTEVTEGIPTGAYITGDLVRDYVETAADAVTVRVLYRSWMNDHYKPAELQYTYTDVQPGTFYLWAVDANGVSPIYGVYVGDSRQPQTGPEATLNGTFPTTAYVIQVSGDTEIICDWYDNHDYQNGTFVQAEYTHTDGQGASGTETVGSFRLDAASDWQRVWTSAMLNEAADRTYTYRITNVKEYTADGTEVAQFDGFAAPISSDVALANGRWTAEIKNRQHWVDITATKSWDDGAWPEAVESVTFALYKSVNGGDPEPVLGGNGQPMTVTADKPNDSQTASAVFEGLEKPTPENGIVYSVKETAITMRSSVDQGDVTLYAEPEEGQLAITDVFKTPVVGTVTYDDNSGSVMVTNDEQSTTLEVQKTWADDTTGETISYRVFREAYTVDREGEDVIQGAPVQVTSGSIVGSSTVPIEGSFPVIGGVGVYTDTEGEYAAVIRYRYKVEEDVPAHYTASTSSVPVYDDHGHLTGYTLKITNTPKSSLDIYTDLDVTKEWEGVEDLNDAQVVFKVIRRKAEADAYPVQWDLYGSNATRQENQTVYSVDTDASSTNTIYVKPGTTVEFNVSRAGLQRSSGSTGGYSNAYNYFFLNSDQELRRDIDTPKVFTDPVPLNGTGTTTNRVSSHEADSDYKVTINGPVHIKAQPAPYAPNVTHVIWGDSPANIANGEQWGFVPRIYIDNTHRESIDESENVYTTVDDMVVDLIDSDTEGEEFRFALTASTLTSADNKDIEGDIIGQNEEDWTGVIKDLPRYRYDEDTHKFYVYSYEIAEYSITIDGYSYAYEPAEGAVGISDLFDVETTGTTLSNTLEKGALSIQKTAMLNGEPDGDGELNGDYTFTLTGRGTAKGNNKTVTITLTNGVATAAVLDSTEDGTSVSVNNGLVTVSGLSAGVYRIAENLTTEQKAAGIVLAGEDSYVDVTVEKNNSTDIPTAEFVNSKDEGDLTVSKTVTGTSDKTAEFLFTVTLIPQDDVVLSETYVAEKTAEDGTTTEDAASVVNNIVTFTLKAGETYTIRKLPVGTAYTVTETPADGYTQISPDGNATGSVVRDGEAVAFTNERDTGSLTIQKDALAKNLPVEKEFIFTVVLTPAEGTSIIPADLSMVYETISVADDGKVTLTVKITGNGSKTITGIPSGTSYTITEADSSGWKKEGIAIDGDQTIAKNETETPTAVNVELTSVEARKVWEQGASHAQMNGWPEDVESVEFTLYKTMILDDDTVTTPVPVTAADLGLEEGSFTNPKTVTDLSTVNWENLPTHYLVEDVWREARYSVKETKVTYTEESGKAALETEAAITAAFSPNVLGSTVTNHPKTQIEASKVWNDENNKDGKRPDSITFILTATDSENQPVNLTGIIEAEQTLNKPEEGNEWPVASWSDLPVYTASGHLITYSVTEAPVDYYMSSVTGDAASGFTITNEPLRVSFDILKVAEGTTTPLPGASFTIVQVKESSNTSMVQYEDGAVESEPEVTGQNGTITFDDIPQGYFEIKETDTPDGYIIEGDSAFYIKVDISGIKLLKKVQGESSVTFEEVTEEDQWKVNNVSISSGDAVTVTFTVENTPGAVLPSTGGPGTRYFMILGSILVMFAGTMLCRRRRAI